MSNQKNSDNKSNKKQNTKNMRINEWPRHGIQALWAFITNSHVTGFVTGKIYTGKLKNACVPGLNCYSCPGAVGACPIGSLQAVIGSWNFKMAYYVVGFLIFIGAMVGRLICGFLCPFGLIQDLLNKIPFPKKIRTFKGDKLLRKLKYVIFAVFVILLPLFLVDIMGQGAPYFCKLICPAGTLEGGLPLVLLNKSMRSALGWLYIWKNVILIITIILSILIYRPFCKYICPLGALYSIFNPVSLYKYRVDKDKCSGPELLFLPRCCWRLSYRFSSGCDRELEFQDGLLCGGISYLHRSYGGKADLRFSLSLRTDSGSAE